MELLRMRLRCRSAFRCARLTNRVFEVSDQELHASSLAENLTHLHLNLALSQNCKVHEMHVNIANEENCRNCVQNVILQTWFEAKGDLRRAKRGAFLMNQEQNERAKNS